MVLCFAFEPFALRGSRPELDAKELALLQNAQQRQASRLLLKGARLD